MTLLSQRCGYLLLAALFVFASAGGWGPAEARKRQKDKGEKVTITLIAAESLDASGLLEKLLPEFTKRTNIAVKILPRGTGTAFKLATSGQGDVLLMDDHVAERWLVKEKIGLARDDVMYAELYVVGPRDDPAGVAGMISAVHAFKLLARSESNFISRGDDSGTHRTEKRIWSEAGIIPSPSSNRWYTVTEADMRTTLGLAAAKNAYTLTDAATWLSLKNRKGLKILVKDDPRMQLRYGVVVLNPKKVDGVRTKEAQLFANWITSKEAQKTIEDYELNGMPPFVPNRGLTR
jgi:tungstate transport system substrate-binding protein